jgi:O-antigen ligase
MVKFLFLITIAMAIVTFILRAFGDRRNPYKQFDLGSFCLLGIVGFSFLGFIVVQNRFLYAQRVVEIIGYGSSYYLGRSFLRNTKDLKLLLTGLCLGILAFTLPWTVGYVIHHGLYMLGRLHEVRQEVGLGVARESGSLLLIFAFGFSISGNSFPPRVKRFAFWLVAIPAVICLTMLVSRAAILLIPVAVVLTFIFSNRRRAALWTIIVVGIIGSLLIFYFGDVLIGIQARLLSFSEAAATRMVVYRVGIEKGLSSPLFGVGAQQMRAKTFWWHIHNDELTILAEHGIFAFVLYVLFWIHISRIALRARVSDDIFLRTLASSILVVMICYLAYAQIEPMYFSRGGILFTFLMGAMTSLYHKYQAEKQYLSYAGT